MQGLVGAESRIYRKALSNELAIAVGSGCCPPGCSIPELCAELRRQFPDCPFPKSDSYLEWDNFVDVLSAAIGKKEAIEIIRDIVGRPKPETIHHNIAAIPISNFIDLTFDRSLYQALICAGKKPICHGWRSQRIGSWTQSNPNEPNIFFGLPKLDPNNWPFSPHIPFSKFPEMQIMSENMREMLISKDMLLVGICPEEAHQVLQIFNLSLSADKTYVDQDDGLNNADFWATYSGTIMQSPINSLLRKLVPAVGHNFSGWDQLVSRMMLIDIARDKQNDTFISYFHGDKPFAKKLKSALELRDLRIWIDESEILIGDSFFEKINEGLRDSYTFIIILSPEALQRAWVKRELGGAFASSMDGEIKILPILHKECKLPELMGDYKYADFRDDKRFDEQLGTLVHSIKTAVAKARGKA